MCSLPFCSLADNISFLCCCISLFVYLYVMFLNLFVQVLHATVIRQMQMAETLEAVKESDLRVSISYLYLYYYKN